MQRIDGAYLYDFGQEMKAISAIKEDENMTALDIFLRCSSARNALENMVYSSVFSDGFRTVSISAKSALDVIDKHSAKITDKDTFDLPVSKWDVSEIKTKLTEFEAIMRAELQNLALYYVSPKGGFDNKNLVDHGSNLFPSTLHNKVPEACPDVVTGARCMAFELWTAMAFHFHRANEAVLRRYYDSVIGTHKKTKIRTMGSILKSMQDVDVGNKNIRAAINNIVVFHRNPIAHPDQHITSSEEALSLYAGIRAAIGYMLDSLPDAQPALISSADVETIAVAPALFQQ